MPSTAAGGLRGSSISLPGVTIPQSSRFDDETKWLDDYRPSASIDLAIDFTRPDGQRTRPLLIDGKRLYVDEHYISVWSPVLR